jgi:hypothetical protein
MSSSAKVKVRPATTSRWAGRPVIGCLAAPLREKLVTVGARIVRHGRYVVFQLAEVAVPQVRFAQMLGRIAHLRPNPPPLPA